MRLRAPVKEKAGDDASQGQREHGEQDQPATA